MSKFVYLTLAMLFCSTIAFADTQPKTTKPAPIPNLQEQIKNLENQQRMLSMKMYQYRIKLISEDSDLLMLHNQIMKLHKKLAIELNSNQEMKDLIEQSKEIDIKIANLIQPKDKKKTVKDEKSIKPKEDLKIESNEDAKK